MKTTNFLQDSSFQLTFPRFPNVQFYGQGVTIPEVSLPAAHTENPFVRLPFAGDKMAYAPFRTTFICDDNMENYEEILKWIQSIGFHTSNDDFTNYPEKNLGQLLGEQDITMTILSSKNNPVCDFVFHDAIPVGLSAPEMTTTNNDIQYLYCTAVFEYSYFKMVRNQA